MTQMQDPAAMRQVRELERLIEARLEEARQSNARVVAAREQAELLVGEFAAEAAAEADRLSARILQEAREWVQADEAEQQRIGVEVTQRAVRLREELVAATVAAVLTVAPTVTPPVAPTVAPTVAQRADRTPKASR
ncbi:hypothetical protein GCM10011376_17630 [Nocardioides flavus (ex Wang et al. 2016)]|uniref:Uncharacterized protein n=1 Tax=Nocardioides flavus (ex Wang et al. 2016) TaxID=2058780 RepID=A0ABQ3HHN8_9ACTN|nr:MULTISPECIES: hypothetical protein [Actinomycetes]QSR31631.1 hypothetical protein CFI00_14175 [Nocardioides sp. S5]GHE17153.1 hypothetical protein GCM10011376_17630 [Nocardioides flavus (ex Wang et al. 2016)]